MLPQFALPALISIVVAFLLSAAEAAIFRMSRVRAHELFDEGRSGAKSLMTVVGDSPAYLSVIAFLRVVAEADGGGPRHPRRRRAGRVDLEPRPHQHRDHGGRLLRRRRRLAAHAGPPELRHRRPVERALRRRPAPRARPGGQAARRARQRRDAWQGLHRRARSRPSRSCATSSTGPATPRSSRTTSAR